MTRRACVIGYPIEHSRSPLIHGYWLKEAGIDGSYGRVSVAPEDFAAFAGDLAAQGLVGANVTVPHKEAAFALAEVEDPAARRLGAVNTLWLQDGVLKGANTDVEGFLANLDAGAPGWDRDLGRAVVLGAGGAARAVLYGLQQRGVAEIILANRTFERAEALAARFGAPLKACAWSDLPQALAGARLLVNTTSLGMAGQPALELDLSPLDHGALVTDIVYVPLETPLLTLARARGHRVVDGLGMLLYQAVPGFERWFGVRPEVTPGLRALIEADIRAKSASPK
jgi:shikimate dehydrogenase